MSRFLNILGLFIAVTIVGLIVRYTFGEDSLFWQLWSSLDISFAVALGLLAGFAYYQMQRGEDEIKIVFKLPNREIDTRLTILRKDATRSEILGLLGMIQKDAKTRFKIASLQNPSFLKELHRVQKDYKVGKIEIGLTQDELKQFKQKDYNG